MTMTSRTMKLLACTLLFLLILPQVQPARILAAFPHVGKSHYYMFRPFVYRLAERGHQVHIITYFPEENPPPNIKFVDLRSKDREIMFNAWSLENFETHPYIHKSETLSQIFQWFSAIGGLQRFGMEACTNGLGHPNLQKFLKEDHNFDLLIVEFFNTDCFASLAHVYNVPLIGIFSSAMMPWHNDRFGNPDNPTYIPNHFLPYSSKMSFSERLINTYLTYGSKLAHRLFYDIPSDAAVKKYIGDNIPPVHEIVKNTSLFLLNTHFSLFQPRPLVPAIVELGGFHVSPPSQIPEDLLNYIEGARNGVIFFSLGSTIKGSTLPRYKLRTIQNVFANLPYRILWKWEDDEMPDKPSNVMIRKWLPQNDILSHPKVKLFVTHCGLMGTEEAVFHGVPMLLMPLFGDQPVNAASCKEKGIGVMVNYYTLTEHSFSTALNEALKDRYAENAKRLSKIFMDRPLSTIDTSIFWTEYVIRHEGALHLRSAAIDLPWYQEFAIDVIVFSCLLLLIWYKVTLLIFRFLIVRGKSKAKTINKKKKN